MTQTKVPDSAPPDEEWSVAQVASHMNLSYQTARNQMLQGVFGQSNYDAAKRHLTVSSAAVQRVKSQRDKPKKKRTKSRTKTASAKPSASASRMPHKPPK